jgi:hypothetical protein
LKEFHLLIQSLAKARNSSFVNPKPYIGSTIQLARDIYFYADKPNEKWLTDIRLVRFYWLRKKTAIPVI